MECVCLFNFKKKNSKIKCTNKYIEQISLFLKISNKKNLTEKFPNTKVKTHFKTNN